MDFSKEFDSVLWEMILTALRFFGFGDSFTQVVRTLFRNRICCTERGQHIKVLHPARGIRQGCCASPYLFNLVVEMLAILIRENRNIKGLHLNQSEIKLSQFPDDLTYFLRRCTSLSQLLSTLDIFAKWSGFRINVSKSQLLYPKGLREGLETVENIPVRDNAKILGISFFLPQDANRSYENNFKVNLDKARQVCRSWTNRALSLKEKVTVINPLITSLFQYPCAYIHTRPELFKEF